MTNQPCVRAYVYYVPFALFQQGEKGLNQVNLAESVRVYEVLDRFEVRIFQLSSL